MMRFPVYNRIIIHKFLTALLALFISIATYATEEGDFDFLDFLPAILAGNGEAESKTIYYSKDYPVFGHYWCVALTGNKVEYNNWYNGGGSGNEIRRRGWGEVGIAFNAYLIYFPPYTFNPNTRPTEILIRNITPSELLVEHPGSTFTKLLPVVDFCRSVGEVPESN